MAEVSHEELFRCLFAEANDAFVIFRPHDLVVVDANPSAQRITGRRKSQLLEMSLGDLIVADDASSLAKLVEACRKTSFFHSHEGYQLRRAGGNPLLVNISISRIHVEPAPLGLAVVRDVTRRRQAEELARLLQSEMARIGRIAVVGEMAATLAHEVNQPLCAIANDASACKRLLHGPQPPDQAELAAILQGINAAAVRASEIIDRLRAFVAKRAPQRQTADVNALVRDVAAMIEPEARARGAVVVLQLCEPPLPALVDAIQIQQVVVNLLTNAFEAMAGAQSAVRTVVVETTADEQGIVVSIADTGPGIEPDRAQRIFEPYFTTKPQGLGIGLSLSRTIVQQHGGRLWLAARDTSGARFIFTLPHQQSRASDDA